MGTAVGLRQCWAGSYGIGWDESFLPFPALRKEFIRGYLLQAAWLLLRNIFIGEDFCFVVLSCCQLPGIENNDPECELMHPFW